MASQSFNLNLNINANANSAQNQLKNLQKQLQDISNMKIDLGTSNLTADIEKASEAAMKLSAHLATATNPQTGNLDFTKFYTSIQKSGASLEDYGKALQNMGPAGQKAFVSLADSISKAEIPLKRTSKLVDGMWDNLKKTIGWQLSSSMVHGFIGSMQQAMGYAKDLNKSLTDIRIVTGASSDQMAQFAKEANKAAKSLSTTTTDYTKASLIYYQQGLSDQEVKARTETTIKMANATGTSAQKVSDQMTAIWNNYDNGTKSLTHYADVMTALGAATASSTDEIAQGLQKFAAISDTVGLSYEYAATALATITSTSRESADVVGNSLKTLFTRIQGLQLGETLDDGTTLNKYSTALAKVGISIKDSSGELKDMDLILDEMGNKWETLARDEQMALAQTVAGVRQYTQLMTLMENWDQFKQNLNIANTSGGTLDAQAAIYAESWEAASQRVRASWEGLWDNLISSDGFIAMLDVTSGLIGMLDNMVTGLGGAGGALATFGGLVTKVFNKQIASTISDVAYSISMLNPKTVNNIKEEQIQFIKNAKAALSQDYENPLYGPEESKARKLNMENSLNASKMFLENKDHMSEEQLLWEQMFSDQAQVRDEMRVQAAREVDNVNKRISDNFFDLYSNQENMSEHYLGDNQFFVSQEELNQVRKLQKEERDILKREDKTGEDAITEADIQRMNEIETQIKNIRTASRPQGNVPQGIGYEKEMKDRAHMLGNLYRTLNEAIQSGGDPSKAEGALKEFGNAFKAAKDSDFTGDSFLNMFKELGDISSLSLFTKDDNGQQVLNTDLMGKLVQVLPKLEAYNKNSVEGLANQIYDRILLSGNFTGSEEDAKTMRQNIQDLASGYLRKEIVEGNLDAFDDKPFDPTNKSDPRVQNMLKKQETQNKAEAAVAGAQGVMQTLAAVESFKALGHELENLGNGTASLMSILSGMTSLSLNAASGFQGLHMAMSQFFTTLSPKAVTGWSLGIMGALAAVSLAFEAFDYFTTSAQEYATSIARSTQNLQNAATTTAEAFEQSQQDSETHLANVRKIESYSQDPSDMTNAIYEANKQAIDMITKYGQGWKENNEYTVDQNTGLIKIKESVLKDVQEEKESVSEDFERTANLAQATQQMESSINNFTDGVHLSKEYFLDSVIPMYEAYLSGSEEGRKNWESFLSGYKGELNYDQIIEESAKNYINGLRSVELISQQNTGKILQEQGYNFQDTQGYKFLQEQASDIYQAKYLEKLNSYDDLIGGKNGWIDQMDPEAIKMAERYLEAQGRLGVEGLKYRNGELKYYSDDTTGEQSIEWEDVKRWQAEQEAEKAVIDAGDDGKSWLDKQIEINQGLYKEQGKGAEAILSYGEFGSLNQVSIEALKAADNILATSDKITAALKGKAFTDFTQAVDKALDPVDTFESLFKNLGETTIDYGNLSAESLQNLNKNIHNFVGEEALGEAQKWLSGNWENEGTDTNKDGKKTFEDMSSEAQNLVKYTEGIEQMLQASGLDAEGMAQAFNQIAQMDWTEDAGVNLRNIVATIGNLGGDINIADWDHLRSIMQDLSGIMPDYSGTIAQLIQIQQLLNSLKSGDSVTAEINVLLNMMGIKTISDGKGGFIVTSSQEEIDAAATSNQAEINDKVTARRNTSAAYNNYKSNTEAAGGTARTKFESYDDLQSYASENSDFTDFLNTASGTQLGSNIANGALPESSSSGPGDTWYNTPWMRSLLSNWGVDTTGWEESTTESMEQDVVDQVNDIMEAGQEGVPAEDIQSLAATYEDAAGLMEAINSENSAFRNEDGLVDSRTLEYLQTLPETSQRATEAINQFTEAEIQLQELKNSGASEGEISNAQSIVDEAAAYAELQTAIDEAAATRELDAEAIANHVSRFQGEINKLTNSQGKVIESTNDYNKRLMALAIEYEENSEGLADLQSAYKDYNSAVKSGDQRAQISSWENMRKAISKITKLPLNKVTDEFMKQAKNAGILEKALKGDVKAIAELEDLGRMEALTDATSDVGKALQTALKGLDFGEGLEGAKNFVSELNSVLAQTDMGQMISEANAGTAQALGTLFDSLVTQFGGGTEGLMKAAAAMNGLGIGVMPTDAAESDVSVDYSGSVTELEPDGYGGLRPKAEHNVEQDVDGEGAATGLKFYDLGGGGGSPGGGGGGGGGGAKEPKKVANKRKSQTVKRYKRNDAKRKSAEKSKKSAENQKDYLYGESKIAQMEKINKLAQKEANITSDRIKESRKYLEEDRENLIKYMQKYGFEAEFDSDGFLANYEEAWTAVYEEIAALYEDNLLTEEEEKIEEDLNVKLEELEGALEDYENSLTELADDIEKWEESMYEMFDNEIEQMEHKVEFKLELDEDSLNYIDYLIENLGESAVRAIDKIELIADKTDYLFNSIETAYQGVQDIYALSGSPLHLFATGGADIDGLLTESQVEALRGQADSLMDFADQLREIRDTIQEQVAEVFDMWTEKVNHNISALEQYGSVMEYFKNIVDLTGNDIFGLSTDFVRNMESAQIDQSIDQMEANKVYYEQLQEMRANVEYELQKAQMSGDEERIAYWEEHLRAVEEEMQSAQDSMLSALENTLTMISDQFAIAMEDAVEAFNKSIYSSGGLEGLSTDYSLLREEADLMAEDYDKIYQLSKISRNINKTLDDTKIIAGKQRLNSLLSEINDLQASGVEMSKYDLEYLEAKYQLYLAQIELENSKHDKDTVRLTRDSEGNWGYVYTTNEEKVNEAQQKYEDALYEMQNKNHEYLEEMSGSVIDLTQQMNEEIAGLKPSDFANLEEYNARVEEIQQKYLAQIERRESELDKAITNNQDLYEKDWKAYSEMTGYKISADKDWIDSFKETTLGYLTESESVFSDFGTRITEYAATLADTLSGAAGSYFSQIEEALNAYDTSIAGFGAHITTTYKGIQDASDATAKKTADMATQMKDAFNEVVTTVGTWQDTEGLEITEMLDEIATYLKDIFDAINTSANIKTDAGGPTIGQQEATRLLSEGFEYNGEHYDFGTWTFNKRGDLNINDGEFNKEGSNLVDYHAYLATQVQEALDAYYSDPDDEMLKAAAEALIKKYWAYRSIIDRVYDPGEIEEPGVPTGLATGGYTGEWGDEGKLAILHEKELVLSASDTANFLEALNISRDVIHSMIEMNARASSLGLGDMIASSIKDNTQTIEQTVHITAEFPEATDRNEIEAAFDNLINMASQYAFRSE